MGKLTRSEQDVLEKLANGEYPKEVADERGVSISAISKICRRAKAKLGARTTYQAVLFCAIERFKR